MNAAADLRRTPDEAAAWWDSRLRSPLCTQVDRAAFAAWCEAPANAAAFERLQSGVAALHEAFAASPELLALHDEAQGARHAAQHEVSVGVGGRARSLDDADVVH